MARTRAEEAFGATASGYAAGFLPLPLAVTAVLLLQADHKAQSGSVSVLWVLLASIPAALVLGPLNTRRTLTAYGDGLAHATARASVLMGIVGLVLQSLVLVPLLYLGWIGLVLDVALTSVVVPGLARQRVLSRVDEAKAAERIRRQAGRA